MSDFFLDSNICIYVFDKADKQKQQKAFTLLKNFPNISSQVIIEIYNACKRKLEFPENVCDESISHLTDLCRIIEIKDSTIRTALAIKSKYGFSFLDSMIVAAALESECAVLYSEDLQHKQIIENKLTIVNPF